MKKIIKIALALMLALLLTVPALAAGAAAQPAPTQSGVMKPMYTTISSLAAGLAIDSIGCATCGGTVSTWVQTYAAYLTVSLQKQNGSTWQTVTSWNASGFGFAGVSANYWVGRGTYRIYSSASVYNAQGVFLESASRYSSTVTY